VPVPVDPSRGAILALLVQSPDVIERLRQAGVIGYLILGLGGIALLVVGERFVTLIGIRRRVIRQQKNGDTAADNPLGRLREVERGSRHADAETLGLKLDQAIMKEIPRLRVRLPMLAVVATAAPLLGLLGTVAGMIETFQSMTLFGAGDPKVVSGGISLALVATELGLIVAIPILLLHGWLFGISNQIIHVLEEEIAALVARREEQIHAVPVRAP
jgi:biopolymer transport protein ExbB